MRDNSMTSWVITIISLVVFILTFFIFFHETSEVYSSLTAAIFSACLVLGTLIVVSWFVKAFKK